MKTYKATYTEILERTIDIEANSLKEAHKKAQQLYENEDVVLDANDFKDSTLIVRDIEK